LRSRHIRSLTEKNKKIKKINKTVGKRLEVINVTVEFTQITGCRVQHESRSRPSAGFFHRNRRPHDLYFKIRL
jgi:hypothetical protein